MRLLRELWDDLAKLMPKLPLVLMRLVERLHLIFAGQHPEPCEILSAIYATGWAISLLATPQLLHSSIYLHQIEEHVSREWCLVVSCALSIYWWAIVLFGGQPSAFINNRRSSLLWMRGRIVGLTLGIIIWGALAIVVSLPAISPGTFVWGTQACYCACVQMVMGWRMAVDREIVAQQEARESAAQSLTALPAHQ